MLLDGFNFNFCRKFVFFGLEEVSGGQKTEGASVEGRPEPTPLGPLSSEVADGVGKAPDKRLVEQVMAIDDVEIDTALMDDPKFQKVLKRADEYFNKYLSEFLKTEEGTAFVEANTDVFQYSKDLMKDFVANVALKEGRIVYRHNLIYSDNQWGYGFHFPKDSFLMMFKNEVKKIAEGRQDAADILSKEYSSGEYPFPVEATSVSDNWSGGKLLNTYLSEMLLIFGGDQEVGESLSRGYSIKGLTTNDKTVDAVFFIKPNGNKVIVTFSFYRGFGRFQNYELNLPRKGYGEKAFNAKIKEVTDRIVRNETVYWKGV